MQYFYVFRECPRSEEPVIRHTRSRATCLFAGQLRSSGKPSSFQRSVALILTKLGYEITEEYFTEQGFSIDIVVHANKAKGLERSVAVEVDGPTHFTPDGTYTGKTKYKVSSSRSAAINGGRLLESVCI